MEQEDSVPSTPTPEKQACSSCPDLDDDLFGGGIDRVATIDKDKSEEYGCRICLMLLKIADQFVSTWRCGEWQIESVEIVRKAWGLHEDSSPRLKAGHTRSCMWMYLED